MRNLTIKFAHYIIYRDTSYVVYLAKLKCTGD